MFKLELSNYIENKIDDFNKKYYLHSKIASCLQDKGAKNSKRKYDEVSSVSNWSKINNNKDVENYLNKIGIILQDCSRMVNNNRELYPVEYVNAYISMYSLLFALQKVARCLDDSNCDFNYTEEDINIIFNKLDEYAQQLDNIHLQNACRD